MTAKQRSPKIKKGLIIAGIVIAVIVILIFTANTIVERLIMNEIRSQLGNSTEAYIIETGKLDVNIASASAKIKGAHIYPSDTGLIMLRNHEIPLLVDVNVGNFSLKHIDILGLLKNKEFDIGEIAGTDIQAKITLGKTKKDTTRNQQKSFQSLFKETFKKAQISSFNLNKIRLSLFALKDSADPFFELDSLGLSIGDILIDQQTLSHTIPLNFNQLKLVTGGLFYEASEFYNLSTTEIALNIQDSSLNITGLKLSPRYGREEYNRIKDYNSDLFEISVPNIGLNNLHYKDYDTSRLIHFSSIEIDEPNISIYRDKTLPDAPFDYKPLLAGALRRIPVKVLVDTIRIAGERLQYEEKVHEQLPPGKVFFDPFYISAYHVTNHEPSIHAMDEMHIDFSGRIMAKTNLSAHLKIDLAGNYEQFSISGELGSVDATVFNPVIENLLLVSIESGDIKSASFRFSANDERSNGKLNLFYENLKIEVLEEDDKSKSTPAMSFVANNVVRNKNLKDDRKYLVGTIGFERRKDKAIVNFLWNSVKTGIVPVIAPIAAENEKQKVKTRKKKK
ncbi:MAG: hypothetical protein KDC05_14780 [Bacteroidales bacterium]|nr:hypothetical protein [Bacteroidales bacterium]